MSMLKIAAVLLVIVAGVVGAYVIIKTPNLSAVPSAVTAVDNGVNQPKPSVEWLDKSQSFISDKLGDISNFFASAKDTVTQTVNNPSDATQKVSDLVFNTLKNLDQQGQNPFQNLDLNNLSDPESQNLVNEAVSSVQNPLLLSTSTIDNAQLKISLDNSVAAKNNYLQNIKKITSERFSDPVYSNITDTLTASINNDCSAAGGDSINKKMSDLYQSLSSDYINLTVPSDWLDIHKRMIIYFKKANLVYGDLSTCFQDPIRGYVSIWALPQLIDEGQKIQTDLNTLAKSL